MTTMNIGGFKGFGVRGRVAGAVVGLVALAGLGGTVTPADAQACPADRPCISQLDPTDDGNLYARWNSRTKYDAYNIIWDRKVGDSYQRVAFVDVGTDRSATLENPNWTRTYKFSVQGCNRNFLASSDCSPWATREIALRAPKAPTNVRVINGERVTWESNDDMTQGFRVFARYKDACRKIDFDPFSRFRNADTRSVSIRESGCDPIDIEGVRVCAINPGVADEGGVCSPYVAVANNYRDPNGPELIVRDIRKVENGNLRAGQSAAYDIVVNSLGRRPGLVVSIVIRGSGPVEVVEALPAPGADAGRRFSCSGTGTVTCTGEIGGEGEAIQGTIAIIRVQVRGVNAGNGAITATVDADDRIAERDEENNSRRLSVAVK